MNRNKSDSKKTVRYKGTGNWLKNSLLVRLMVFLGALQDGASSSFLITRLLGLYSTLFGRFEIGKRFTRPFRIAFSREMEQSAIMHRIDRLCESFLATPLRSYGTFFISFAVYYLAVSLVKAYFAGEELINISIVVRGAVSLLLPLPLLFAQKDVTLAKGLLQSRFCSYLLFDLLGLERRPFEKERRPVSGFLGGFLGGILTALIAVFVPVSTLVWIAVTALFVRLCYVSPEAGMILSCLCMPFFRGGKTGIMLVIVAFFFVIKLLRGKRNVKAGFYTCAMAAYLVLLLFGGLVTASSTGFEQCSRLLSLSLAFFLPALLFYRKEWIERTVRALVLSGVVSVLWASFVYGMAYVPQRYAQFVPFVEDLQGRFLSFSSFGSFAVALFPLLTIHTFMAGQKKARFALLLSGALMTLSVVLSKDPGIWICYFAVLVLLAVFKNRNTLFPLMIGAVGAGVAYYFFVPDSVDRAIRGFSNGFSVDFPTVWQQICQSFDRFFAGTGIGSGGENGNFYSFMLTEQGLAGVIVLTFLLIGVLAYGVYAYYKNNNVSPQQKKRMGGLAIGLLGLLLAGVFENFWQDEKMLFLIFFLAGAIVACGKVLCDEGARELRVSEIDRDYYYIPVRIPAKKRKKQSKNKEQIPLQTALDEASAEVIEDQQEQASEEQASEGQASEEQASENPVSEKPVPKEQGLEDENVKGKDEQA